MKVADTFALQFKVGHPDIMLEASEDAEVSGDPSKLTIRSSHRDFMEGILVGIYGVASGKNTRAGHRVSDDGSAPVDRAHLPDHYTTFKKEKKTAGRVSSTSR